MQVRQAQRTKRPILIVEDCPEDYTVMVRAFETAGLNNPIVHAENGDQALDYLFKRGDYEGRKSPQPEVVLLDLNLPGTDGREVLREIKRDETLRKLPVVVLTTSDNETDVSRCYAEGASSYVKKPMDVTEFFRSIALLKEYWIGLNLLPDME